MTFGPRGGSFSGSLLDPFGSGRGGLGRYNITGETISSLAEHEAYAVSVAWANGQATDEAYLASLRHLLELANPGTREFVTAENRLHDAEYTIARNALVRDVNNATDPASQLAAYHRLLTKDEAHLASMTSVDSQAYRQQLDRIASIRGDIRQARYGDMVDRANRGQASTSQLLTLAQQLAAEARAKGDADVDEWGRTIEQLRDRVADEKLADSYQAYQRNRKRGEDVLAEMDARMAELDPSSAMYKELARQREDLAERVRSDTAQKREAEVQGRRAAGTMTDAEYLGYLRDVYADATPGTSDAIYAGNRLREFTFSLAEDKLRFDVEKGTKPVSALVSFYRSYQRTMLPGSERWRSLELTIDRLKRSGSSGSGGGSALTLGPKLIGSEAAMADILGRAGSPAPPDFGDLFRINVTSSTSRKWWDNNLRSMVDAFSDGARTWTYFDKRGRAYELPFEPGMMEEMDAQNVRYAREGLRTADTAKEVQDWVGRLITASKAHEQRASQYTMDVYRRVFGELDRAKERAIAGGRWAEYENLVFEQQSLARAALGLSEGDPLDVRLATNPYLTDSDRGSIELDLERLVPRNFDENSPYFNPAGDVVLGMIRDGAIQVRRDGDGWALEATLEPDKGFVTQLRDGTISLVPVDMTDPGQVRLAPGPDGNDMEVPRYFDDFVPVTVRYEGDDVVVWQPKEQADARDNMAGLGVWRYNPGTPRDLQVAQPNLAFVSGNVPRGPASYERVFGADSQTPATIPVVSTYTVEGGKTMKWMSVDGETWLRAPGDGTTPRLVMGPGVEMNDRGQWEKDGQVVDPLQHVRFWGPEDSINSGWARDGSGGKAGSPFGGLEMRKMSQTAGTIDLRPSWVIDAEEVAMVRRQTDPRQGVQRDRVAREAREAQREQATLRTRRRYEFAGELAPKQFRTHPYEQTRGARTALRPPVPTVNPLDLKPKANPLLAPRPAPVPQLDPEPVRQPTPQLNPIPKPRPIEPTPAPEPTRTPVDERPTRIARTAGRRTAF